MDTSQSAPETKAQKEPKTIEVKFLKFTTLGSSRQYAKGATETLPSVQAKHLKKKGFVKFL